MRLSLCNGMGMVILALGLGTAGAAAQAGLAATGTATIATAHGPRSGVITVWAWGTDHCKITLDLSTAGRREVYTATSVGPRTVISGRAGLDAAVPLPLGPHTGCALLSVAVAVGADTTAAADPATGRLASLTWDALGQPAILSYSGFTSSPAGAYAATVAESVGGSTRLTLHFTSAEPRAFIADDFALPPAPPLPSKRSAGGGQ